MPVIAPPCSDAQPLNADTELGRERLMLCVSLVIDKVKACGKLGLILEGDQGEIIEENQGNITEKSQGDIMLRCRG